MTTPTTEVPAKIFMTCWECYGKGCDGCNGQGARWGTVRGSSSDGQSGTGVGASKDPVECVGSNPTSSTTETTTIATQDYDAMVRALRAIKSGQYCGGLEAARENRWHEYAAHLQQIAHDALKDARIDA